MLSYVSIVDFEQVNTIQYRSNGNVFNCISIILSVSIYWSKRYIRLEKYQLRLACDFDDLPVFSKTLLSQEKTREYMPFEVATQPKLLQS